MVDLIQVRATQPGFYGHYRMPGDVFNIVREGDFSFNWMIRLSPPALKKPETVTASVTVKAEPVAFVPGEAVEPVRQKRKYVRKAKTGE